MPSRRRRSSDEYLLNIRNYGSSSSSYVLNNMPSCTQHPRWIAMGCIIFSIMLSCTIYMSRSWEPRADLMEIDREWQWPDMDPWKTIAKDSNGGDDDSFINGTAGDDAPMIIIEGSAAEGEGPEVSESRIGGVGSGSGSEAKPGVKTWDINDPALTLGSFFNSADWKNQTLMPGSDFVNLLRVLRPVDQAFFITLFVNQSPRQIEATRKNGQGASPKPSVQPIKARYGCGPWIADYVEFQNRILDKTLPSRYTIHSCPRTPPQSTSSGAEHSHLQEQQAEQSQPCGDIFSQMVSMTSAFAWSVIESRGFFSNVEQMQGLQESFGETLFQHWTTPPKADSTAKINTADMTSRDLDRLFRLHDPLFSLHANDHVDEASSQYTPVLEDINFDKVEDEQLANERAQSQLRDLRSKSRNRVSFERDLMSSDFFGQGGQGIRQRRLGLRLNASRMKKLIYGLEQDGVELVLDHDLLPRFVNTTRSLRLFLELGLPLPDHIIRKERLGHGMTTNSSTAGGTESPSFMRAGAPRVHAPSAHGSLFGSASGSSSASSFSLSSSTVATHESVTTAFHTAIHDERDLSRTQAVPKSFGCLLDILIHLKIDLQQLIHPYATLFKLPAIFSIGIYIRSAQTGAMTSTGSTSSSWKALSEDRQLTANRYLTCARQIAREFAPKRKGQKVVYVVISEDSGMARVMESQEEWDEEVIKPKWTLPKERRLQQQGDKQHQQPTVSKQQQAVLENWIISKTDFQVVSDHSDFAKVAVWRTRREGRSIVIRENPAVEKEMESSAEMGGFVDMIDCGVLLKNLIVTD